MKIFSRQKQRGLTLIELMISMALGLALTAGAISIFQQNKQTYNFQESISRIQESGRFAMNLIARDIRSSGFRGCRSRLAGGNSTGIDNAFLYKFETTWDDSASIVTNFSDGISGYEANDDADASIEGSDWDDLNSNDLDAAILAESPATGSDIIVVRAIRGCSRIATMPTCATDDQNEDGTGVVDVNTSVAGCFSQYDTAIISNCEAASVFVVTDTNPTTSLAHAIDAAGSRTVRHANGLGNTQANLKLCYGENSIPDGSTLSRIVNVVYYIGTGTAGFPSLFRMENGGTPSELIEGIEDMQILYGEDTDGDNVVDGFVTADNVTNWSNVLAARLNLLVQSLDDNIVPAAQTLYYDIDGDDQVDTTAGSTDEFIAPDNRIRRVFSTTIALRNRMT
jgi:type IV pilus assembly protein PilW